MVFVIKFFYEKVNVGGGLIGMAGGGLIGKKDLKVDSFCNFEKNAGIFHYALWHMSNFWKEIYNLN